MGIGQALIWLRDIDKSERPTIMLYDSGYAANMVTGRWQPNTNTNVVQWARGLLAEVEKSRTVWAQLLPITPDAGRDMPGDTSEVCPTVFI